MNEQEKIKNGLNGKQGSSGPKGPKGDSIKCLSEIKDVQTKENQIKDNSVLVWKNSEKKWIPTEVSNLTKNNISI